MSKKLEVKMIIMTDDRERLHDYLAALCKFNLMSWVDFPDPWLEP